MTKNSPPASDRWAVSVRTDGELLTASVALPTIELLLLGIPQGFTPGEIQTWLKDLADVAIETSRSDQRVRPIPQLLHHALTGLLFSQSELWSRTGQPLPCALVFVDGPQGMAFGWVGKARVSMLVNGVPFEPQWVIVRDEAGQEAMSAGLAPAVQALVSIDYWPQGDDGTPAPIAVDAECGRARAVAPHVPSATAGAPSPAGTAPATDQAAAATGQAHDTQAAAGVLSAWATPPGAGTALPHGSFPPQPEFLPTQQPGLAPAPGRLELEQRSASQALPSTHHPSASTFAIPPVGSPRPAEPPAGAGALEWTEQAAAEAAGEEPGETAESVPPAVWSPPRARSQRGYRTLTQDVEVVGAVPARAGSAIEPVPPPEPTPGEPETEPGHPVGRWLSRLMGLGRKPPSGTPPIPPRERVMRREDMPPFPPGQGGADEPADEPALSAEPEAQPIDIDEPHALPAHAGQALPAPVAPPQRGGLAAAGLDEILGGPAAGGGTTVIHPVEGLTAVSAVAGPVEPPPSMRTPPEPVPPYPVLEVKPPRGGSSGPIQIEREPVAPDPRFGIPKLPQRETPKPVRAPAPELFVVRRPGTPPAAPAGAEPPPQRPYTPPPLALVRPGAPPPSPAVPEPPAEFLAEFEASLRVEPVMDPTAPAWPRGPLAADPEAAQPPTLPSTRRGATPAGRTSPPLPRSSGRVSVSPASPAPPEAAVTPPSPRPAGGEAGPRPPQSPEPPRAQVVPTPLPAPPAPAAPAPEPPAVEPAQPVLRAPGGVEPSELATEDVAALMRELPLPTPSAEMRRIEGLQFVEPEIPEGMLIARPSAGLAGGRSRTATWPLPSRAETRRPMWRNPWAAALFVAVLFGVGWWLGHAQAPDNDVRSTPAVRLLRSLGLGGARFSVNVDSDPPGAWVAVDGGDVARRTPTTLDLVPGAHVVTLSMPDLGNVKVPVDGTRGQRLKISEALHGSLDVTAADPSLPVKMSLDGQPQGWLPAHLEKLPPGLHEVQFSGPNMPPWGQSVNIGIRQTTKLVAHPMMSPATGVLQVQASLNDDNGTAPLSGASVFVDGDIRGTTPLTIELPRGPHSLRVAFRGESAPVQVIDLPGGNQRYATFQFGLESDLPPLRLQGNYYSIRTDKRGATVISASLDGLAVRLVREAWLHVRTPDGMWRRYEMTVSQGSRGAMLSAPFPTDVFDAQGRVVWYASAATAQGDEFFTEMQRSAR